MMFEWRSLYNLNVGGIISPMMALCAIGYNELDKALLHVHFLEKFKLKFAVMRSHVQSCSNIFIIGVHMDI